MSDNVGYDKQEPAAVAVGVIVLVILLFTFISGWAIRAYFDLEQREMYHAQVMNSPTEQLNKLRAESTARMHGYGWADAKAGVAYMPIEKGMEVAVAKIKADAEKLAAPAPKEKEKKK